MLSNDLVMQFELRNSREEGIDIGMKRGIEKGTIETLKSLNFSKKEASQYLEKNRKLDSAKIQELIEQYWNNLEESEV